MDKLIKDILSMQAAGYQIDSRLVKEKDIFFALNGEKTDGHLFLSQVADKKVLAAVISKNSKIDVKSQNLTLFRVDDVLVFLQALAKEDLKRCSSQVIGITGSMGKTTTKEFLSILLEGQYEISKTYKNYNSQRGLPIAILNMDKNADFLVLEMAMDERKEIEKLVNIAPPSIALISQLVEYHGNFDSMNDLAYAKKEIFSHENTKIKVINEKLSKLKAFQDEKYLTFSIENNKADFYLDILNCHFYEMGQKIKINLPFQETHLLENLTAAISICRLLKMEYENIFKQFQYLKTVDGRFEKINIESILFIKDYYNANPNSTIAALKNLPDNKGKKIAVLGSNLELGKFSKEAHEKIIDFAKEYVDEILCFGDAFKHIKNIKLFYDHKSLANYLKKIMKKQDVVLVKGSRAMQMEKIFDFIN